jgi:hypothetical protein
MEPLTATVPGLVVKSELNTREHWAKRNRRKRTQQDAVLAALWAMMPRQELLRLAAAPQLYVRLTRVYAGRSRAMDDDNLAGAFKGIRDSVAMALGRSDAPGSGIGWRCLQERGDATGVRIEIQPTAKEDAA